MSDSPWLVLDVNGLCHRAWHIAAFQGQKNGVIYGVLRDISILQDRFNTANIAFCFDDGESLRKSIYPQYKANRTREGKAHLYSQIEMLKIAILKKIGFNNVFYQTGYEADDWLALFCQTEMETVLVTRDHDMHQLLTQDGRVICYDPQIKSHYDWHMFTEDWTVPPTEMVKVMALMGCKGDNIEGIKGVGPETAVRILKQDQECKMSGLLTQKWREFCDSGKYETNLKLVTLPWEGGRDMRGFHLKPDTVTQAKWNHICDLFQLDLVSKTPMISP